MTAVSSLTEDFTGPALPAAWTVQSDLGVGAATFEIDGVARTTFTAGSDAGFYYATAYTTDSYDLDSAFVEVTDTGGTTTGYTMFDVSGVADSGSQYANFNISGGDLTYTSSGTDEVTIPHNPTAHRWLKLTRDIDAYVHYWASPDGEDWTELGTSSDPLPDLSDCIVTLSAVDNGGPGEPERTVTFDNFNLAGGPVAGNMLEVQRIVAVTPGQTWTALAQARTEADDIGAALQFKLYSGATLLGSTTVDDYTTLTDEWAALSYVYSVPADGSVGGIQLGIVFDGDPDPSSEVVFRNVALLQAQLAEAQYFDGTIPSMTADYLWEGEPHNSRSHYYAQRTLKALRLKELIQGFIPAGSNADLLFAQPEELEAGGRVGIDHPNYNPPDAEMRPASITLVVQWARTLSWYDITNGYTDWDDVTDSYDTWASLYSGVTYQSWDDIADAYTDWDDLADSGMTWQGLSFSS